MQKSKYCLTDKSKCALLVVSFMVFLSVIFYFGRFDIMGANANPDYICTKVFTNPSCNITSCGEWKADHTRECKGIQYTSTSYYNRRSSCAAGYNSSRVGESSGDSGRTSGDFYSSKTCYITQEDNIAPIGELK